MSASQRRGVWVWDDVLDAGYIEYVIRLPPLVIEFYENGNIDAWTHMFTFTWPDDPEWRSIREW